jgi:AcrR family transcriptional regulator
MNSSSRNRAESRRDELLAAAVRVFARKGYHTCRVSDIADEAGTSHGLVYHYFSSKDEVLDTILRKVAALVLHAWRRDPETVRVLVREISRSPVLQERIGQFQQAFDALEHILVRGQERGEFDADLDPRFATYAVWGTLDDILTGWVLGRLPSEPEDVDRAEATVSAMLRRALGG